MNKKTMCSQCPIKGYSKDICRVHSKSQNEKCPQNQCNLIALGKKAALGAGIGITGALAGIAVLPVFGAKAIDGHTLTATLSGAGGAVGAGANVVNHKKRTVQKD